LLTLTPAEFAGGNVGVAIKISYLMACCFVFYGWFWTHGGQTLGMRVWNLYLINPQGKFINWPQAAMRYLLAWASWGLVAGLLYVANIDRWYLGIGLGFTWMLTNHERLAWHDILSNTRIIQLNKKSAIKKTKTD
jgi:uncharacterized RDD family membrane protein YckC